MIDKVDAQADEPIAKLEGEVKANDEQIAKLEGAVAEKDEALTKLAGEKSDLAKQVADLEAQPAPAKGNHKAIAKGQDLGVTEAEEAPKTSLQAIQKAHQRPMFMR